MAASVTNDFYNRITEYVRNTLARSEDVEGEFDNVQTGFDAVQARIDAIESQLSEIEGGGSTTWPSALNSRFLVSCAGTNALTGTAPGSPDSSDTIPDETHLLILPANDCTGSVTLDIGTSEGAEPIKKDAAGSVSDLASGDLRENIPYWIQYDSSNGYWTIFIPNINSTPTVLHKTADYTITSSDVDSPICLVAVDASGGSVDIDLPTVGDLEDKLAKVFLDTDPGTNDVEVYESDGTTELWTGVEKGDYVLVTSDGTNYKVVEHVEGHYARVYVDADETVAQGTSAQVTNISEDTDTGGIWNTTNDEVDIPFDCWIDLHWSLMGRTNMTAEAKLDTTFIRDATTLEAIAPGGADQKLLSGRFQASANQKLELWAHNLDTDSGGEDVKGDAAGDESFATIKLTRIY